MGYRDEAGHNPAVLKDASYRHRYAQFLGKLKLARVEAGLTQVEVATRIKRPQSFVSKIESGERRVDVVELAELAKLYRKPVVFFLNAPPKQALEAVLNTFTSRALFAGTQQPVSLRIAELEGLVYLDLGDPTWKTVEISAAGWKVVANPPVRFVRSRGMKPLPIPVQGGDLLHLRSFLNIAEEDWPLLLVWILMAFRPQGPYPVLILNGEQGSCKSSTSAAIRNLIDPNIAALRSGPRDERDLFIAAKNSRIIALDNLSYLSDWLSDSLCRIATGGGYATRKLHTDDNEIIINLQRPILLNGISELAVRGDLVERAIVVSLPTIDSKDRRDEAEFWSEFESVKSEVFGALLTALAQTLAVLPHTKLDRKPRMADFCLFGVAVERALGWIPGTFMNAFEENRLAANAPPIESSPVALAVQALAHHDEIFEGTATELLQRLSSNIDTSTSHSRSWPESGWKVSSILRRLAPNLSAMGIEVTFQRSPDHKRERIIKIRNAASNASGTSASVQNQSVESKMVALGGGLNSPSQPFVPSHSRATSVVDTPDAPDALVQPRMLRGEI